MSNTHHFTIVQNNHIKKLESCRYCGGPLNKHQLQVCGWRGGYVAVPEGDPLEALVYFLRAYRERGNS